ncbi:MAG: hypothetical protein KY475_02055 [Planctomycetes bacterium]|nr:hypothetical protein [Planctomycetota bacterium]
MTPSTRVLNREPEVRPEGLRSAPSGYRELSIPAIDRRPFTEAAKTLVFHVAYKDRPAAIAVTVNEKGRLVNAYVGGALARVVPERVLLAIKKQRPAFGDWAATERWRDLEDSGEAPLKTLGENLAEMTCAASAVAKTVLESLDVRWQAGPN